MNVNACVRCMWLCECAYRMLNCTFQHFISLLVELPVFVYSSAALGWFRTKFNNQSTKTWQFFFSIPFVCHIEQHNYGILVLCFVWPCASSSSLTTTENVLHIWSFGVAFCIATKITNMHRFDEKREQMFVMMVLLPCSRLDYNIMHFISHKTLMLIWFLTWAHSAMHSPQLKSTTIPLKNGNFGSQMYHLYNDFFLPFAFGRVSNQAKRLVLIIYCAPKLPLCAYFLRYRKWLMCCFK